MDTDLIDMRAQYALLRRRWLVIAAATLVGLALAAAWVYTATPTYVATASVLVDPMSTQSRPTA